MPTVMPTTVEADTVSAMSTPGMPSGFLKLRHHKDRSFWEARWRDSTHRQRRCRLGRAWVEPNSSIRRKGRVKDGFLSEHAAHVAMEKVIAKDEAELAIQPRRDRAATFDDAVTVWLDHLEHEKRAKPSTMRDIRVMLASPTSPKQRGARIMRTFSGRKLADISTADVQRFLTGLDRQELSARNCNRHRQALHSIFAYAMRSDTFGLRENPAATTSKRPENGAKQLDVFDPAEVELIAEAARAGLHRSKPKGRLSGVTEKEWRRGIEQDAGLYVVAFSTGLRLGELAALRWKDVGSDQVNVSRAMSAGIESSTKSRAVRSVPLGDQARAAFDKLRERDNFTSRDDHVFCSAAGTPLDSANIRKRFIKAQEAAGVRVRTFHDLRHSFASRAIIAFDPVTVQRLMGHADLQTTARYLHSRPRDDEGAKLSAVLSS